jgi:hypothetical protein
VGRSDQEILGDRIVTQIETHASIDLMGHDFYVYIEVSVTSWGERNTYSPTAISPPDGREFEIVGLALHRDEPGWLGPAWHIDPRHALFDVLANDPLIKLAACDAVLTEASGRYWQRRRGRRRAF